MSKDVAILCCAITFWSHALHKIMQIAHKSQKGAHQKSLKPCPSCRSPRELSNGGTNASRNLNLTPVRPVQSCAMLNWSGPVRSSPQPNPSRYKPVRSGIKPGPVQKVRSGTKNQCIIRSVPVFVHPCYSCIFISLASVTKHYGNVLTTLAYRRLQDQTR